MVALWCMQTKTSQEDFVAYSRDDCHPASLEVFCCWIVIQHWTSNKETRGKAVLMHCVSTGLKIITLYRNQHSS